MDHNTPEEQHHSSPHDPQVQDVLPIVLKRKQSSPELSCSSPAKRVRSCHSDTEPDEAQKSPQAHSEKPTNSPTFVDRWVETLGDDEASRKIHSDTRSALPVLPSVSTDTTPSSSSSSSPRSESIHPSRYELMQRLSLLGIEPPRNFFKDDKFDALVPGWVQETINKVQTPRPRSEALSNTLSQRHRNVMSVLGRNTFLGTEFNQLHVWMTALELNLYRNLDDAIPQTNAQQTTDAVNKLIGRYPHVALHHILKQCMSDPFTGTARRMFPVGADMVRPEVTYGYATDAFRATETRTAELVLRHFTSIGSHCLLFPYLIVKARSPIQNDPWQADIQALADSAASLRANSGVLPDDFNLVFSLVLESRHMELQVMWKTSQDKYMQRFIDGYCLHREEDFVRCRDLVLNIFDWALGRFGEIKRLMKKVPIPDIEKHEKSEGIEEII